MKLLRDLLDQAEPHFKTGGKLEKLYPVFEMMDTFLYTPADVTRGAAHVRDGIDLKRIMITVVVALVPCILMAMWNTGYQINLAMSETGLTSAGGWRGVIIDMLEIGYDPTSIAANFFHGSLYFIPVFIVCNIAGGFWESVFSMVRRHEINEGFLVTGMLFPLTLPPTIPLWQVAIGISFGVVIGKEIFGGTGMNFLNPALTARAFLFFAYPAFMSGDAPWIAAEFANVDNFSGATLLAQSAVSETALQSASWWNAFVGWVPGSMGETSAVASLLGLGILLVTRVASWHTVAGIFVGTIALAFVFNGIGSDTNPMFAIPFYWHMVLGGWAFGMVFMATDPVSSAFTSRGRFQYGLGIGVLVVLIRVVNPAYPEGMMLAILFMNMFAPLLDHYVVQANINRRLARSGA